MSEAPGCGRAARQSRFRVWVSTRTATGIELEHRHTHRDGGADALTHYGGHMVANRSAGRPEFPADDHSRELFVAQGISASATNALAMEIVPGERFSYLLRRPGRSFCADFDLRAPVETPPPPWGVDEGAPSVP